jgi:formylglycine-generating enzyme required for sulfatase activity
MQRRARTNIRQRRHGRALSAAASAASVSLSVSLTVGIGAASGCSGELPPYGQLRLRVMTDAPVPNVVSRLRLDVYAEDGTWVESREAALPDPTDWPATLAVFSSNTDRRARVRIRLRGYASGALRDYRGERYLPPPGPASPVAEPLDVLGTGQPRLVRDGVDVTPTTEPTPGRAIDRLLWATLEEGAVVDADVVLRIECAGTMADIAGDRTCTDARSTLVPTPDADREVREVATKAPWQLRLDDDARALPAPRPGGRAPDGTPLYDDQVVVAGGAFVLGGRDRLARAVVSGFNVDVQPERVFVIPPLVVDRYEYTVARYREALRQGFRPPGRLLENDLPALDDQGPRVASCTFSRTPIVGEGTREAMPLSCVDFAVARALCQFEGADLPTEAEWEYLATAADRPRETSFPWGSEAPTCADAAIGRSRQSPEGEAGGVCGADGHFGPLPVDRPGRDTTPSGVHGMTGNVAEWTRDTPIAYRAACWASAPLYDPFCEDAAARYRVIRGGTWMIMTTQPLAARGAVANVTTSPEVGFRCVRKR